MSKLKKLQDERAAIQREMTTLLDNAETGNRSLTNKEERQYRECETRLVRCDAQLAIEQEKQEAERKLPTIDDPNQAAAEGRLAATARRELSDGGFTGFGDFMADVVKMRRGEGFSDRLKMSAATIREGLPSAGGFAVPEQFVVKAFADDLDDTVLLKLCDRAVMTSATMHIPTFPDDTHATSPHGITWSSIAEDGSFGSAQAVDLGALKFDAKKMGALFRASNEWFVDSAVGMRDRLDSIFRKSLRWYIESLLWNGTGAGQPLGALVGSGKLEIDEEAGQAADTVITQNIVNMWARLKPGSHARSIWVANQTVWPQLATLTLTVGTGGAVTSLLQSNADSGIEGAPANSIFGRPVYLSEHLPVLGDAGDIVLCDPTLYLLGDRQQITLDTSEHVYFTSDATAFRAKVRLDAMPVHNTNFTPANGDTCGWLVHLAERA